MWVISTPNPLWRDTVGLLNDAAEWQFPLALHFDSLATDGSKRYGTDG